MKHIFFVMICLYLPMHVLTNPDIAVIGTGYVGLVTGAGLAEYGNKVVCADIDSEKIIALNNGIIPIYEPNLDLLVAQNKENGQLFFTDNIEEAIRQASIIIIAVGTPMGEDGSADLTAVFNVIGTIARVIDSHKTIVTKSTVPVGTGALIRYLLEYTYQIDGALFNVVSNPEFLREGSAVHDFLNPDRIVIGAESTEAFDIMCEIYKCVLTNDVPAVLTNIPTAEIIKYASNAFLATKLSFINEIANLCDATGGHVQIVSYAMGLDPRISPLFLKPGPGYGGYCFPKDTQALVHIAEQYNLPMNTVQGAISTNNMQHHIPVQKLCALMDQPLEHKTVAVLGLAFKANTDDIRYSPSITAIQDLLTQNAYIKVYDPQAMSQAQKLFPTIMYCSCIEEALSNADACIIMTEWDDFKYLTPEYVAYYMQGTYLVDARNILNLDDFSNYGFQCDGIGQSIKHNPTSSCPGAFKN